jgi:hypothetical protein
VVGHLPDEAIVLRQETLMSRPDIAGICSETALIARSRDPAHTRGWHREPWPVQVAKGTWLLYCLAGTDTGEVTGAAFREGRG